MRRIPFDFQVALELFYWERMTAPEIAAVLDVPEGTARSRIRLGRERGRLLGELPRAIQRRSLAGVDALQPREPADPLGGIRVLVAFAREPSKLGQLVRELRLVRLQLGAKVSGSAGLRVPVRRAGGRRLP